MPLKSNRHCLLTTTREIAHIIHQLQSLAKTLSNPTTFPSKPIPYARGHEMRFVPKHKSALSPMNRRGWRKSYIRPHLHGWIVLVMSSQIVIAVVVGAGGVLGGASSGLSSWLALRGLFRPRGTRVGGAYCCTLGRSLGRNRSAVVHTQPRPAKQKRPPPPYLCSTTRRGKSSCARGAHWRPLSLYIVLFVRSFRCSPSR